MGQRIQVRVMRANGLSPANMVKGLSDPYARISLERTGIIAKTDICHNTINPLWYQTFYLDGVIPGDVLRITVFDDNRLTHDINLGECTVDISQALAHSADAVRYMNDLVSDPELRQRRSSGSSTDAGSTLRSSWSSKSSLERDAESVRHHEFAPSWNETNAPRGPPPPFFEGDGSHQFPPFHPRFAPHPYHDAMPSAPPMGDDRLFPPESPAHFHHFPPPHPGPGPHGPHLHPGNHHGWHGPPLLQPRPHSQQPPPTQHWQVSSGSWQSEQKYVSADYSTQQYMCMTYPLSKRGNITLIIADSNVGDMSKSSIALPFRQFVNHKFMQNVGDAGKRPFKTTSVGKAMAHAVSGVADAARKVHPALDFLHPISNALKEHPTWKIETKYVSEIFGSKMQSWNKNYDAAKKIFDSPMSMTLRKMLQAQHSYLYGGLAGVRPLVDIRKDLMQSNGQLWGGTDFLHLVNAGIRNGKPRIFTYVIMKHRMYFAETGAKFFKDMNSKHAMHANGASEVVYAGEFHFRQGRPNTSEPPVRIVVDNNSGTYAPDKADLPKVREFFMRNFIGLPVEVIDFKDPLLKRYQQEVSKSSSMDVDGSFETF